MVLSVLLVEQFVSSAGLLLVGVIVGFESLLGCECVCCVFIVGVCDIVVFVGSEVWAPDTWGCFVDWSLG